MLPKDLSGFPSGALSRVRSGRKINAAEGLISEIHSPTRLSRNQVYRCLDHLRGFRVSDPNSELVSPRRVLASKSPPVVGLTNEAA